MSGLPLAGPRATSPGWSGVTGKETEPVSPDPYPAARPRGDLRLGGRNLVGLFVVCGEVVRAGALRQA